MVSSLVFLIVISPVPTLTISSKVKTIFAPTATSTASSAGVLEANKGFVVSTPLAIAGAEIWVKPNINDNIKTFFNFCFELFNG
jgi:hypothetical protein